MRWAVALVAVAGCGRVGFAMQGDAGSVTGDSLVGDSTLIDGLPDGVPDAGLPAGLVAWFPLDEASGPFVDALGGLAGTCNGALCPVAAAGRHGGAQQFDGTDDCITVPAQAQLEPAQVTLAVWANQAASTNVSLVAMRSGSGSTNAWQLEADYAGANPLAMTFTAYNGSFNEQTTTANDLIVLDTWQHVAVTWGATGKRVYIDGVERASDPDTGPALYTSLPLKIGCDDNGGTNAIHYDGLLDDVQIYNRALSSAEIAMLAVR